MSLPSWETYAGGGAIQSPNLHQLNADQGNENPNTETWNQIEHLLPYAIYAHVPRKWPAL